MRIEDFINRSQGHWKSMRSGHSLAFQQFEEITSTIKITKLRINEPSVARLLELNGTISCKCISPFRIDWDAESDWEQEKKEQLSKGFSILIPIPSSDKEGKILRSMGYLEPTRTHSTYKLLCDGTLALRTEYQQSITDERIWFVSENVRCRSSVISTSKGSGILQTSFASEIRLKNIGE